MNSEICCECGHSVSMGSGRFVNRVAVLDDFESRKETYPHPEGEYICPQCDCRPPSNCPDCGAELTTVPSKSGGVFAVCAGCTANNGDLVNYGEYQIS